MESVTPVCSLPSIDHMTCSKPVVTSPINRQHMSPPGHKTMPESKGALPPLSVLLRPTPQHSLSEVHREHHSPITSHHTNNNPSVVHGKYNNNNSMSHEEPKQQQQQQHISRTNSPLFSSPNIHTSGQLNYPDHRLSPNGVSHSSQRAIAPDMRLPSIKHFESNIQQSSPVKQHQQVYPLPSQTPNLHVHSPIYNTSNQQQQQQQQQHTISENGIRSSPIQHGLSQPKLEYSNNTFSHPNLPSQSPSLAQNSTMWTRPQATSHSPRQSQSPVATITSSQKVCSTPIFQNLDAKPIQQQAVQFITNDYSSDYQNSGSFAKDNAESSTQNIEKTLTEMQKITENCTIISQFATQYSDYRNQTSKFGPLPPSHWVSNPTGTPVANLEQQVPDMINKAYEILGILNGIKSDIGQNISNDQDTINLIRTKRTTVGPSTTRTKYRKRSKRAAPPGRCHSCNISETPEWRRGPDGARTLCNACGLHFAKLTRKRALSTMQHHQSVHKITRTAPVLPSAAMIQQQSIMTQPKHMGMIGGMHLPSTQLMQSPPKRLDPMNHHHHQMNGAVRNYLKNF